MREQEDRGTWRGAHIVDEQELSFESDAQAKKRARRRQNIVFSSMAVVVLLVFLAATLVYTGVVKIGDTAGVGQASDNGPAEIKNQECPDLDFVYQDPGSFKLVVMNTTDTAGLAGKTAESLEKRGFKIADTTSGFEEYSDQVATVFAGPQGYAQALTVQRQVPGSVFVFDPKSYGTQVSLALGSKFDYLVKERKLDTTAGKLTCAPAK
ncbi:LytR C-terminal domain-containing protein [Glutamicibacter sp.]|uniref:LytR C-terminal domain-containing protein n=1 Tax=Glutamicibacter sp. TaxID=1931995 RepID=UPI0028BD82F8|nr:LytR C-terminal domain-containing protein [Glutamicibacter sp.]